MNKKDLLVIILKKLLPYWELAEGILILIENGYTDENAIDGLIHILGHSVKKLNDDKVKLKLQKGLELVKKIKIMEENEKMSECDLDKLLADI